MFYVIGEPDYRQSSWFESIMNSLITSKRQKRFALTIPEDADALRHIPVTENDAVFVIGTNLSWLDSTLSLCEQLFGNRVILLSNHENPQYKGKYSIVAADVGDCVRKLYNYLIACKKRRIALFGINPSSSSDAFRQHCFLLSGGNENDIFYNLSSLSLCCESFLSKISDYDAVICANDYAAISLIRHLQDPKKIFIVSCGAGTMLIKSFKPSVTHMRTTYESFGKAGLDIYEILRRSPQTNSVKIYLSGEFVPGETTDCLPMADNIEPRFDMSDIPQETFFNDPDTAEMVKADNLLRSCDDTDLKLLHKIVSEKKYNEIAEEMFLSESGVKYNAKRLFDMLGVQTKTDFIEIMKKYLL